MIKDGDAHVRLCFLTGVSKFSKVSLFSGLNNLIDITLEPPWSALCGYTGGDLDAVFGPSCRASTGSGSVTGTTATAGAGRRVYTPIDVLLLLRTRGFKA